MLPTLNTLAARLTDDVLDHPDAHRESLDLLVQVSGAVQGQCPPEVTSCLVAAGHLLEVLAGAETPLDRSKIRRMAGELVVAVGKVVADLPEASAKAAPAPSPAPSPAAPPAAPARSSMSITIEDEAESEAPSDQPQSDPLLGQILRELGWVDRTQLAAALRFHRAKGLPLGECLLLLGTCPPEKVLDALKLQQKLREGQELGWPPSAQAGARGTDGDQDTDEADAAILVREQMFLGEVLLGIGMITNEELEKAMHMHHHEGVSVGQALQNLDILTEEDVERGLELKVQLEGLVRPSTAPKG